MKVVFRVDASDQIGIGHFMRCLTLAQYLYVCGFQIHFICREHVGNLILLLKKKSIEVSVLPAPNKLEQNKLHGYENWLGVSQDTDANQTLELLKHEKVDWLVVDHYGINFKWESLLRSKVKKIMVIDDLNNRNHDCDILLDQNYYIKYDQIYTDKVAVNCKLLLGPRYALLRPEYVEYRKLLHNRNKTIESILVFFGGSDINNITEFVLDTLLQDEFKHLKINVVVGPNYRYLDKLKNKIQVGSNTTLYMSRPHLADLIFKSDISIGACGTTNWERMCLGLPTVGISIAENQLAVSKSLEQAGLIFYAGYFADINYNNLTKIILDLINDHQRISDVSTKNLITVDGLGAKRVVELMFPSEISSSYIRKAIWEDIFIYFSWANEVQVRNNAVNTTKINWLTHKKWYEEKIQDFNCCMLIMEVNGLPVGQIRFDNHLNEAHIDYSIDDFLRGRGWGARLVQLGTDFIFKTQKARINARVKANNKASINVFLKAGFKENKNKKDVGYRNFYKDKK